MFRLCFAYLWRIIPGIIAGVIPAKIATAVGLSFNPSRFGYTVLIGPGTFGNPAYPGVAAAQPDESPQRIDQLEARLKDLEGRLAQRAIDAAYLYVHSNWNLIRWFLVREQDRAGEGSEVATRARSAETTIRDHLPRNLRAVQFAEDPMAVAYRRRIETTVRLNRHGYTFFD